MNVILIHWVMKNTQILTKKSVCDLYAGAPCIYFPIEQCDPQDDLPFLSTDLYINIPGLPKKTCLITFNFQCDVI